MILPVIVLDGFGNLGVKSVYSDDNGVTWDSGAYAMMPDGKVGILVETSRYGISLLKKDISELLSETRNQQ